MRNTLTQLAARAGVTSVIGANHTDANAELTAAFGTRHTTAYGADAPGEQLRTSAPSGVDIAFDGIGGQATRGPDRARPTA